MAKTSTLLKKDNIQEIPLSELYDFENHPFQVRDDEEMQETADSIKRFGVFIPGLARPHKSGTGYELIAGHRRKHGCELAGLDTMPVIIRNLSDDDAVLAMVDSNLQRETILPSERAFAYKMKLDALKHQGKQLDVGGKLSVEIVAEESGESKNQIFRYIRLTYLIPELLNMVDEKKIAFNPAVELSYLKENEQFMLLESMEKEVATPSLSQAQRLKKLSREDKLTQESMDTIMAEEKKPIDNKVTLSGKCLTQYFPPTYTPRQMHEIIIKLLESWHRRKQQTRTAN